MLEREKEFLKIAFQYGYITKDDITQITLAREKTSNDVVKIAIRNGLISEVQAKNVLLQLPKISPKKNIDQTNIVQANKIRIGSQWNGYHIISEIGRGGMGIVYKAQDLRDNNKMVAIKILSNKNPMGGVSVKRFIREAKAGQQLEHQNIISIYDTGEKFGYHYIVMQYIEGKTFKDILKCKDVSLEERIEILIKVCKALNYAHAKKIIHRDIKPSNILVDENNIPYLSDFGLAKMLDSNSKLTQTGSAVGTPYYMSPEQVQGAKKKIGALSDIYSLGIVLYQILTGKTPFYTDKIAELYYKIISEEAKPPRYHNKKIPSTIESICLKAMNKQPHLRYKNAKLLSRDLENFLAGKKVDAARFRIVNLVKHNMRKTLPYILGIAVIIATVLVVVKLSSKKPWEKKLQKVREYTQKGDFQKALFWLQKVKSTAAKTERKNLAKRVFKKLKTKVLELIQQKQYEEALEKISLLSDTSNNLKLKVEILEKLNKIEELRLVLARIFEISKTYKISFYIGKKAYTLGYLEDALKYLQNAYKINTSSLDVRKLLLKTLIQLERLDQAESLLENFSHQENNPDIFLSKAYFYYKKQKNTQALSFLKHISSQNIPPKIIAQKHFLMAQILWKSQTNNLIRVKWLEKKNQKLITHISSQLDKIEMFLKEAKRLIAKSSQSYRTRNLQKKIDLYIEGLQLEKHQEKDKDALFMFQKKIQNPTISQNLQIFFGEVLIRSLIGQKYWKEAYDVATALIQRFPWIGNYYLLRSLISLRMKKTGETEHDIIKCRNLQRWNIIPLENIIDILSETFTQEEFYLYFLTTYRYIFSAKLHYQNMIFRKFLDISNSKLQTKELRDKKLSIPLDFLLHKLLHSRSKLIQDSVIKILVKHHAAKSWEKKLFDIFEKNPALKKKTQKRIEALRENQKEHILQGAIAQIKQLLIRYGVFYDPAYALELRKFKEGKWRLLKYIIEDNNEMPIIRFLAARILIDLKKHKSIKILEYYRKQRFPKNLIATCAMREFGLSVTFPEITKEDFLSQSQKKSEFLKILAAFYINPVTDKKVIPLLKFLFHNQDNLVSLCSLYNLLHYKRHLRIISQQELTRKANKFVTHKNIDFRGYIIQILGETQHKANDIYLHPKREKEIDAFIYRFRWKHFVDTLAQSLKLTSPQEIQLAALQTISRSKEFRYLVTKKRMREVLSKLSRKIFQLYYKTNSYIIKYWAIVAIQNTDNSGKVWDIVFSSEKNRTIRLAALINIVTMSPKLAQNLVKLLREEVDDSEKAFVQVFLPMLAYFISNYEIKNNKKNRQFAPFAAFIKSKITLGFSLGLRSNHIGVKRSSIASYLWLGNREIIPKIHKFLRAKDPHIKRAAATTLAGLSIKYSGRKAKRYFKYFMRKSSDIKNAAALGFYEPIAKSVISGVNQNDIYSKATGYDLYIKDFEYKIKRDSRKKIKQKIFALKYAYYLNPVCRYLYELSLIYFHNRKYTKVLKYIKKGRKIFHHSSTNLKEKNWKALFHILAGRIMLIRKKQNEALSYFQKAAKSSPFDAYAHFQIAKLQKGKEPAIFYEKIWEAYLCNPQNAEPLLYLGNYLLENKRLLEALQLSNYSMYNWKLRGTGSEKQDENLWMSQDYILAKKGKGKAQAIIDYTVKNFPHISSIHKTLAKIYEIDGVWKKAAMKYLHTYICNPQELKVLWKLAWCFLKQGKKEQAIIVLKYLHSKSKIRKDDIIYNDLAELQYNTWVKSLGK